MIEGTIMLLTVVVNKCVPLSLLPAGMAHAKEMFEQPRKQQPSTLAVRSYLNGFCCDPVYNSLHSEKEGDGDEAEDIPEKHAVPE